MTKRARSPLEADRHYRAACEARGLNPETGTRYSRDQLKAAFDMVANPENWKLEVRGTIPAPAWDVVREAVVFFTGSVPSYTVREDGRLDVTALGYYAIIGA